MKLITICFSVLAGICVSTNVLADEGDSFVNYDSIVSELKGRDADIKPVEVRDDDWDWNEVAIHGDVGIGTSLVSVTAPSGQSGSSLLKGIHIGFGINLFTTKARAEGAFTSYGSERMSSQMQAELKEFELRIVFLPISTDKTSVRMGTGLAARYLELKVAGLAPQQASTPSSLFLLGFERKLSKNVSLGPDLSYRSALISDTFDKSAWDATLRINAMF